MTATELAGQVVLVTGGARGIGLDAAQRLHRSGARVALVDVDGPLASTCAEQLGAGALGIAGDVTDRTDLDRAVAETRDRFGRIDVVIANAGVAPPVDDKVFGGGR